MRSLLRSVRKRKKRRVLGEVEVMSREEYSELELDSKVEMIRALIVVCVKFCKKYFRKIQFLSVDRRRACGNVGKLNVFGEAFPSLRGNPRLLADFL